MESNPGPRPSSTSRPNSTAWATSTPRAPSNSPTVASTSGSSPTSPYGAGTTTSNGSAPSHFRPFCHTGKRDGQPWQERVFWLPSLSNRASGFKVRGGPGRAKSVAVQIAQAQRYPVHKIVMGHPITLSSPVCHNGCNVSPYPARRSPKSHLDAFVPCPPKHASRSGS